MNKTKKVLMAFVVSPLFFLTASRPSQALDLLMSGAWFIRETANCWVSQRPVFTGARGEVLLHVVAARAGEPWRVEADLGEMILPKGLEVWIRRSGSGQGDGWIDGGLAFVPLRVKSSLLFSGVGNRMQVPLEVKITGATPETPRGIFRGGVHFLVVSLR